jgi:hypothetical protein
MAYVLTPKAGAPALPMENIIGRLRESFAHVELNAERASRELEESARYMAGVGPPHYDDEDIRRSRQSIGRSVYVVVADDPGADLAYVSFLLEPEHEEIFIDCESGRHEAASRELRERLARVLDYEMELV